MSDVYTPETPKITEKLDVARNTEVKSLRPGHIVKPDMVAAASSVVGNNRINFDATALRVTIQNKSSQPVYREIDGVATPGSFQIPSGGVWSGDVYCRFLGVYLSVQTEINGVSSTNIVIEYEL